ncbi:MAG TPA: ABC transporter substrate-binding protein [Nitrospirota bacterium]
MDRMNMSGWILFVMTALMLNVPLAHAGAEKRISVLIFSEEVRYTEALKGIRDVLKDHGFGEPAVRFSVENAGGSKAKAAELVKKFAAEKMDLIFTLGTSATIAVSREIRDIPIVFAMVFDPVEAKIARDWRSSGNNTTGVSPRIPMARIVEMLKTFGPTMRLAVLYTPGEKNSELQLRELQGLQAAMGIKVVPVILVSKEDVARIVPEAARTVDAMYLTGSSVVGSNVPMIVEAASRTKVVTITHLDDLVEKGSLLGICANSYQIGRLAGEKALKVLRGAKPSSIPIEVGKKVDVILNAKTAQAGQYIVPPEFLEMVTKTVE